MESSSPFAEKRATVNGVGINYRVGGSGPVVVLIEQSQLVANHVSGRVIPGSGHWLMEEAPKQVIPAIVDFVQ
jgi:hypothetical protein